MSIQGEVLRHHVNGTKEQTWEGFSWPGFFFGVIWLLIKGLYGHFLVSLVILFVTVGFAAPIIWIVYGFIGNEAHKSLLLKKGYLTEAQWSKKENPSPAAAPPQESTSSNLTELKELVELREKGFLTDEEFLQQKAKLLGA